VAELFASGRLIDAILLLVLVEIAGLAVYWRVTKRGVPFKVLLPNLLAGGFLLLALRLSIAGAGWMPCCASLAAAGMAHLFDLAGRWQR
jgi:hypothetical protein